MRLSEVLRFFIAEDTRLCDEPDTERDLEGEARAAPFRDIDRQLGMLPEFELVLRHIEIAARDFAKPDVRRADDELTFRITHRRRPVAASAGLVEHQLAVFGAELFDDRGGFRGDSDTLYFLGWHKLVSALLNGPFFSVFE